MRTTSPRLAARPADAGTVSAQTPVHSSPARGTRLAATTTCPIIPPPHCSRASPRCRGWALGKAIRGRTVVALGPVIRGLRRPRPCSRRGGRSPGGAGHTRWSFGDPRGRRRPGPLPAVQALSVVAHQDRPLASYADRQSIVRAVRGTSEIRTGLLPLPTIRRTRCPRSKDMSSMLAPQASLTRSPFDLKSTARAAWGWSNRSAVNRNRPSSPRSKPRRSHG